MAVKKYKVTIIYKSGAKVVIECSSFSVSRNYTGELAKVEWKDATPRPLYAGVDDIAAIFEGVA